MPRLDFNGTYRWLGLGDTLFGNNAYNLNNLNAVDPRQGLLAGTSSLATLASGQFQEWQLGLQSTMHDRLPQGAGHGAALPIEPWPRRGPCCRTRNWKISHQLADAVRQLELNYDLTETNFNRTLAADRQVEAVQAAYEAETVTLDQLLEAQRRRAEAQTSYFRTLLDYQRAIIMVHFRKGSILEYNNVYLQEGPWPAKAKFDAHRLARQRDAASVHQLRFHATQRHEPRASPAGSATRRARRRAAGLRRRRAARSAKPRGSARAPGQPWPGGRRAAGRAAHGGHAARLRVGPAGIESRRHRAGRSRLDRRGPGRRGTRARGRRLLERIAARGRTASRPRAGPANGCSRKLQRQWTRARPGRDESGRSHAKRELPVRKVDAFR